jgi:hypothetical protein
MGDDANLSGAVTACKLVNALPKLAAAVTCDKVEHVNRQIDPPAARRPSIWCSEVSGSALARGARKREAGVERYGLGAQALALTGG